MTNKLNQLIQQYCPEGVEFKKLGEVCTIETWKLNANASIENGKYMFFTTAKEVSKIDSFRWDTEALLIAGNANIWDVKHYIGKFEAYQRTYVLTNFDQDIQVRFLYFVLKNSLQDYLNRNKNESAMTYIVLSTLQNFQIPIPPLPVQEEIVKILDKFTSLEAELEAELEARKCQYEFYRNQLLAFKGGNVLYKPLSELWILIRWNGLQKSDFVSEGKPCIHYGQIYTHYGTTASRTISQIAPELFDKLKKAEKGDVIFTTTSENFDDIVKCIVWLWDEPVAIWWHAAIFKPNDSILWKYFSYYTQTSDFSLQKKKYAKGIKVVDISMSDLEKIKIPLPPLEQQEAIVYILDHFDQLANDLTDGLPAELHLRQQQYAYYRDMLLNFSSELVSERERESIK